VKPTVLVATTARWFTTARLVVAVCNVGCAVDLVCPSRHPATKVRAVRQRYAYHGLTPLASFADAIAATNPDLIIAGDDLAVRHLQDLHRQADQTRPAGIALRELIERSLGAPESFPIMCSRSALISLARQEGIRAPLTQVISNTDDLRNWISRTGFPVVLKADGTSSGEGVRIARSHEEAKRAYGVLEAPPWLARAVKRALIDQDLRLVESVLTRRRSTVNVQEFVRGREATTLVACWKGEVRAGLHFEVLMKQRDPGPASVLRLIENPEMSSAAARIVRRLKLSGLHGFDFVLESQTGDPYLIEMNPRPTQVGHLTLGPGRDLPAALYAALTGKTIPESPIITDKTTIALFPQEWIRNPSGPYLGTAYHDVPWEEPELVRAGVRKTRNWSAIYSQKKWLQVLDAGRS
jgi:carbamoyl-phosphate synthase L subunit-like protein